MNSEIELKTKLDQFVEEKSSDYVVSFLVKYLSDLSEHEFRNKLMEKNIKDFTDGKGVDSEPFNHIEFLKLSSSFLNDPRYLDQVQSFSNKLKEINKKDLKKFIDLEGIINSKFFHSLQDEQKFDYWTAQKLTCIKSLALYNSLLAIGYDNDDDLSDLKFYAVRCYQSIQD